MTAQILSTELATIISETKRKAPDIRSVAEQSLQDLKALPSTSEAQLAADLRRRPHFINPFLAACKGRLPKATIPAVSCLQRLIVSSGLPKDRLKEVLEAFQECIGNGLDVQLKILQCLPSLLQSYGDVLEGSLQFIVLQLCISLQQVKNSAVSSTASATLQQTVSSLYEKLEAEDEHADDISPIDGVSVNGESIPVRPAAYDAYRVFQDMCLIIEGQPPHYLAKATISPAFGLELIEALLLNHSNVFDTHVEQSDLLLGRVMPLVNSCLSERHNFAVTVRAMRLLCILIREHLETVHTECEVAFGLLNHIIETETQQPWRRALSMETFRLLYSNPDLFVDIYTTFDMQENRRNIIQDNLALFVRLASEKPALIGLGHHSTAPASQLSSSAQDQGVLEAENAAGVIGGDFGVSEKQVPGISNEWSTMKVPCLDQLDKVDGPSVPETYVYSLVLTCVNQLSDVLAKIVLPVAMHQNKARRAKSPQRLRDDISTQHDGRSSSSNVMQPARELSTRSNRSRSIPTNPLDLSENPAFPSVKVVASLISSCWPAVLATSSTFFNAALDAEYYRNLVRSYQKFTQVAGILRLSTPRDALLTSLAKFAVPPSLLSSDTLVSSPASSIASPGGSLRFRGFASPMAEAFASSGSDATARSRRSSLDSPAPTLTQRNLMCLRALVHLAIALGPILDSAWSIVLDSIQKAHVLLAASRNIATAQDYKTTQTQAESAASVPTLSSEISAVESAISRLFHSTSDYPSESFKILLTALCNLLQSDTAMQANAEPKQPPAPLASPSSSLTAPAKTQRRVPSVSGLVTNAGVQPEYSHFAVAKLGETAKANLSRLTQTPSEGWELLVATMIDATASKDTDDKTRKMAADVLARLIAEACISTTSLDEDVRRGVQDRSLAALRKQAESLPQARGQIPDNVEVDAHQSVLDALHSVLEHCGDCVISGWDSIFVIAGSAFRVESGSRAAVDSNGSRSKRLQKHAKPLSARIIRSSFASVQLLCSDFIEVLPRNNVSILVDLLAQFGLQTLDINISLTVLTQLLNVSGYLQKQVEHLDINYSEVVNEPRSRQESTSLVWLSVQQHLAELTRDHRVDVRNGSIHIVYRTLDNCASHLSQGALEAYLHTVLFNMMDIDSRRQKVVAAEETTQDTLKAFANSSKIVVDGCARFFANNVQSIIGISGFHAIWQSLLDLFAAYLEAGTFFLDRTVFSGLTQILDASTDSEQLPQETISKAAALWARGIPASSNATEEDRSMQNDAFVAYVQCIQALHRKIQGGVRSKQLNIILERIYECVSTCPLAPHTNDTDRLTKLQDEILKTYDVLCQGLQDEIVVILEHLAKLLYLPYEAHGPNRRVQQPSFVAFAKKSMDVMTSVFAEHGSAKSIYRDATLSAVFASLLESMGRQYTRHVQGKEPPLWRKATSTSLSILRSIRLRLSSNIPASAAQHTVYEKLVAIADVIQKGEFSEATTSDAIVFDESFDLDSINSCRRLITPLLDTLQGLEDERLSYIENLFTSSLLHDCSFDASEGALAALVEEGPGQLIRIPLGRTREMEFSARVRMGYSCLDELFELASSSSLIAETEQGELTLQRNEALLAPVAHQALLVRCALPLQRYVADQPLRGRMPTPMSQRLELLHILERVRTLYDPSSTGELLSNFGTSVPGWPGVLVTLAPLVNHARDLAGNDRELARAMGSVLNLALSQ